MNSIAILMYHSIDRSGSVVSCAPEMFTDQMSLIADEGFRGISLNEAVSYREHYGEWPKSSVALTFDDGFASVYNEALPVLQQYKFGATVFIVTGSMGQLNEWATPPDKLGVREMLSWQQVSELANAKIELGSHTKSHPDLTSCDVNSVRQEMTSSREEIEAHLGQPVKSFAYPFGAINKQVCSIAAKEFSAACTTELRRANNDPVERLPRVDCYYLKDLTKLRKLLHGELDAYLSVRRLGRFGRRLLLADS